MDGWVCFVYTFSKQIDEGQRERDVVVNSIGNLIISCLKNKTTKTNAHQKSSPT